MRWCVGGEFRAKKTKAKYYFIFLCSAAPSRADFLKARGPDQRDPQIEGAAWRRGVPRTRPDRRNNQGKIPPGVGATWARGMVAAAC